MPVEARMQHDSHFVESLSARFGASLGRWISMEEIETNPQQPRTTVGDLTELRLSIESKGILEPLLVKPLPDGRYRIIAGERRFRAAMEAGLTEVPCIELDVPENEVVELALIENLHRRDLHPFEEAEGYSSLASRHGYTQQRIADAVGKSRVSVTEIMSLLAIPEDLRDECRRADIGAKTVLLQVARLGDEDRMREAIESVASGSTRQDLRARKKEEDEPSRRPARFSFVYGPKGGPFKLNLSFQKSRVDRSELIETLRGILEQLEAGEIKIGKRSTS
ncbi:MAG: ParB/RepB/Spo0J family partition protein [Acidobacteriota bacterium]|nr:ParB/RepB/Spo0J family partition protein [Acidobacteriota bacterium]